MKYPQVVPMPSAVSNWLEEQLEARGIDAVFYTRYILSLLHSDTIDVIYSDEDLHFSHLQKEVKRSGGGSRKHFRRTSDWWRHAHESADKLKRSAAVECLMSASEQTIGIESLIDELCEKLNKTNLQPTSAEKKSQKAHHQPTKKTPVSPQEQAQRYYAAFPPLNPNIESTIHLIPKWIPSSSSSSAKKKPTTTKKTPNINQKSRNHHRKTADITMKATNRQMGKQRFGAYFTSKQKSARKTEIIDDSWPDEKMMYDDLPLDIKELLEDDDYPSLKHNLEMKNSHVNSAKSEFIPFSTTNETSIWSMMHDNHRNASAESFDLRMRIDQQNEWNEYHEKTPWDYPESKWSEESGDSASNHLTISLMKLNHSRDSSPFAEIKPKHGANYKRGNFSKIVGFNVAFGKDDGGHDDLLTSLRSHFRPINEKVDFYANGEYADGATFAISNTWDKINYNRTDSGGMYVEGDFRLQRKYCELINKPKNGDDEANFVLKFLVCQNDIACQTCDEMDAEVEATLHKRVEQDERKTVRKRLDFGNKEHSAMDVNDFCDGCKVVESNGCDRCIENGNVWNTCLNQFRRDPEWDDHNLRDIWSGGEETSNACLEEKRPPSSEQNTKLREDVMQDGDQLLSDLSSLQNTYMGYNDDDDYLSATVLPLDEFSCDIGEILQPKEGKRRHSLLTSNSEEIWSFASRIEEDCLIQMSTIPTLRSVTL